MPFHRIISQRSGLFLLTCAPFSFFFLPPPHCKMNHGSNHPYPGDSGELADGLTNHELRRQTHKRREPFVVLHSSTCKTTSHLAWRKLKDGARGDKHNRLHLCFFFLRVILNLHPTKVTVVFVCGRVTPAMMWSGTTAGLLFPAWPALCQPPDSSGLVFSPLFPGPPLLFPLTFLFSSPRSPTENTAQIRASEPQSQP